MEVPLGFDAARHAPAGPGLPRPQRAPHLPGPRPLPHRRRHRPGAGPLGPFLHGMQLLQRIPGRWPPPGAPPLLLPAPQAAARPRRTALCNWRCSRLCAGATPGVVRKSPRRIQEREGALQGFITTSFQSITSAEHAPSRLRPFQFHPPAGVPWSDSGGLTGGRVRPASGRGAGIHGVRGSSGDVQVLRPGVPQISAPPRAPLAPLVLPPESLQGTPAGGWNWNWRSRLGAGSVDGMLSNEVVMNPLGAPSSSLT